MEVDIKYLNKYGKFAEEVMYLSDKDEYGNIIDVNDMFEILYKYLPNGLPNANINNTLNDGWNDVKYMLPPNTAGYEFTNNRNYYAFCMDYNVSQYLVMIKNATKPTTLYYIGNNIWYDTETVDTYTVTHWQPLPNPPRKE